MKLEYLLDSYEQKIDQRFAELLKRAFHSTERLTSIVQGMYDFARLGAKAASMAEVPLGTLVEEVVGDLHFDDTLDIKIGMGDLPTVWGNAMLLRRVFMNLITNAIKYNDKKDIIVNIGIRSISEKSIARFAEIFVEDNGPGIPKNEIKDIFSMFSRGSTSKGDKEGVGVGLAVVQRIVELHFGKISVETEVGKGTKFVMLLPLEKIDFIK
jgi:two-component system, sensor histidine kinase and response regulator